MKRLMAALVALLLLQACALGEGVTAPDETDLSMGDAIAIAETNLFEMSGLTAAELAEGWHKEAVLWARDGGYSRRWVVSFYIDDAYPNSLKALGETPIVTVIVRSPDGFVYGHDGNPISAVADAEARRAQYKLVEKVEGATAAWEQERGNSLFWSWEDKALFCETYGAAPHATDDTLQYMRPTEDMLTYETAKTMAEEALTEHLNADAASLSALSVSAGLQNDGAWHLQYGEYQDTFEVHYDVAVDAAKGYITAKSWTLDMDATASEWTNVRDDTKEEIFYYNPDGGIKFHSDMNCPTVSDKYLPLQPISADDLREGWAKDLYTPCGACVNDPDHALD